MTPTPVNRAQPDRWKADIALSVDQYNNWFMRFAPTTFREARVRTTKQVEDALKATANLTDIRPETLAANPGVLPMLRMAACPPLARDRLVGLAGVSKNLVLRMEEGRRLPQSERIRFLEPGFGTGAFYSALLSQTPSGRLEAAAGFEIDPQWSHQAAQL